MKTKIIVSGYPVSTTIGNYRWYPGVNVVKEEDWGRIHWPSIERDKRLVEQKDQATFSSIQGS
jgi:hypothetical protein